MITRSVFFPVSGYEGEGRNPVLSLGKMQREGEPFEATPMHLKLTGCGSGSLLNFSETLMKNGTQVV